MGVISKLISTISQQPPVIYPQQDPKNPPSQRIDSQGFVSRKQETLEKMKGQDKALKNRLAEAAIDRKIRMQHLPEVYNE